MASARQIKAGEAFWEATIKDKTGAALARVQAKLKTFGAGVKSVAGVLTSVGTKLSAIGAIGLGAFGAALQEFLELPKRAKDLGKSLQGIDVSKSERLDKAWRGLLGTFDALKFVIGNAIADPLTQAATVLAQVFRTVAQFAARNPFAVKAIAATFVAIAGAGAVLLAGAAAFAALGTAVTVASSAIAFIATPLGATVAILTGMTAALGIAAFAWDDFGRAMIGAGKVAANLASGTLGKLILGADAKKIFDEGRALDKQLMQWHPEAQQAANSARLNAADITGGQRGTFQGLRAENLSIGSGGGAEDRRTRELRERIDETNRILREILGTQKQDAGPVFQPG